MLSLQNLCIYTRKWSCAQALKLQETMDQHQLSGYKVYVELLYPNPTEEWHFPSLGTSTCKVTLCMLLHWTSNCKSQVNYNWKGPEEVFVDCPKWGHLGGQMTLFGVLPSLVSGLRLHNISEWPVPLSDYPQGDKAFLYSLSLPPPNKLNSTNREDNYIFSNSVSVISRCFLLGLFILSTSPPSVM